MKKEKMKTLVAFLLTACCANTVAAKEIKENYQSKVSISNSSKDAKTQGECVEQNIEWEQGGHFCSAFVKNIKNNTPLTMIVETPSQKGVSVLMCENGKLKMVSNWCGEGNKGNPQVVQYIKPNEPIDEPIGQEKIVTKSTTVLKKFQIPAEINSEDNVVYYIDQEHVREDTQAALDQIQDNLQAAQINQQNKKSKNSF